jgi:hypothetical protein
MILDKTQKAWVSQLIYDNVKYNETYLEVLDHVISSLEAEKDEEITFHQKLNQIWNEDFGGYENLPFLEKARKKEFNKKISRRHFEIFASYFKFPLIVGTLIISLLFYIISNFLSNYTLLIVMIISMYIPMIMSNFMYWRLKKYNNIKPSIKDKKIKNSSILAFRIFYFLVFTPFLIARIWFNVNIIIDRIYSPLFMVFVICFILFSLSFFKLYKETFKMELSK